MNAEPAKTGRSSVGHLLADSGWMTIVVGVPLLARLVVTPIRVQMLTPAEFGKVSLWLAAVAVAGGFAWWPGMGLMRYLPSGSARDQAGVVRSWLALTTGTVVVVVAIFAVLGASGGRVWWWVGVVTVGETVLGAVVCYARAVGRFGVVAGISLVGNLGGLALGTTLIDPLGPAGVLAGWGAANGAALVLAAVLLGPGIWRAAVIRSGWQIGRLMRFSAPLALSSGTWMLLTWLDRPLLAGLVSDAELGIYSLAYAVVAAPLAGLFGVLSSTTWNHAVRVFEQDGYGSATDLFTRSARIYTALAVPLAVWLVVFAERILGMLAPGAYAGATEHVPWLVVGLWLYGLLPYRNQHLMLWGSSGAAAISPLAALLTNVVLLAVLVPRVGAVGAAAATACAYGAALLVAGALCRRDPRVVSRLPIRLSAACLVSTATCAIVLDHLVDRVPARLGELAFLGLAGLLLASISLAVEGSAVAALRGRVPARPFVPFKFRGA